MKFLECFAMLKFMLDQLYVGQRKPVPVQTYNEIRNSVIQLEIKLRELQTTADITFYFRQLEEAVGIVDIPQGSVYLTDKTKEVLVDAILEVKKAVALAAFEHFKLVDFEPTPVIIPLMRDIVQIAAEKGAF